MPDTGKNDLYQTDKRIEAAFSRIEQDKELLPEHRAVIRRFDKQLQAEEVKGKRRLRFLNTLPVLMRKIGKPIEDMSKDDLVDVVAWINNGGERDWSDTTMAEYRKDLVRIWKFSRGLDRQDKPKEVRFIRTGRQPTPPTWLPPDELIEKAIANTFNNRDKFIIAALSEGGFRTAELAHMALGDWVVDGDLLEARVSELGKTGSRIVYLHDVLPYYKQWLAEHPLRGNSEAPLVLALYGTHKHERMNPFTLLKVVKEAFRRAGAPRSVSVQLLRKRNSTEMAAVLPSEQLNARQGWVRGSPMPGYYVSLSKKHKRAAAAKLYGLADTEKPKPKTTRCINPLCMELNAGDQAFCYKCHAALTIDAAKEVHKFREQIQADQQEYFATGDMAKVLARIEARLSLLEGGEK